MSGRHRLFRRVPRLDRRVARVKLPVAVVGAVLIAEAAVWLLRPEGVIEPEHVSESRYFTAAQLERARDFSGGQRLLGFGTVVIQGAVLVFLVLRPPKSGVRAVERAARGRDLLAGAALGAVLAGAVELAPLPLRAVAHERAVDFGLSTQGWGGWSWDVTKATGIGALLSAGGAALFLALMRRSPRRWWLAGAAAVVAIEIVFVWLGPVLLAPLFNRFERLPEGRIRSDVETLAGRAGIDVGDVFVVDASRRTRQANAFVTGLGSTKRVVLYDTLIDRFTPAETRLVVAHELAHVKNRDLARGMLWVALVAPAAMFVVSGLTARWARRAGVRPGAPASLPAFALALALVSFCGSVVSNQLSRRVEARADSFALEITREPAQFIEMQKELTLANLSDPGPPEPLVWLFATHPPPVDRIGAALAFERNASDR